MIAKWLPQSSLEWPTSVPFSHGRFGEQASMISCHASPVAHLQKCTSSMWERDVKRVKERERESKRETDLKSSRTAWGNVWKLLFRLIWLWSLRAILPNICGVRKTLTITNRSTPTCPSTSTGARTDMETFPWGRRGESVKQMKLGLTCIPMTA